MNNRTASCWRRINTTIWFQRFHNMATWKSLQFEKYSRASSSPSCIQSLCWGCASAFRQCWQSGTDTPSTRIGSKWFMSSSVWSKSASFWSISHSEADDYQTTSQSHLYYLPITCTSQYCWIIGIRIFMYSFCMTQSRAEGYVVLGE